MERFRRGGGSNVLLDAIAQDELSAFAGDAEEVELSLHTTLCEKGRRIDRVTFPYDAVTSTLVEMPEGDLVEIGLMGADGMVGLDLVYGLRESLTTVVVQVPGRGMQVRADAFLAELDRNSEFRDLLLRYARLFYGMTAQTAGCNAHHGVAQRLARRLLMVHDRVGRNLFPLTHEHIALMLGVRRASVSEAAQSLRMLGAIDYERGRVSILRRETLEAASCACYFEMSGLVDSLMNAALPQRGSLMHRRRLAATPSLASPA